MDVPAALDWYSVLRLRNSAHKKTPAKPIVLRGLFSEAEGTRTPNHRIDSPQRLNQKPLQNKAGYNAVSPGAPQSATSRHRLVRIASKLKQQLSRDNCRRLADLLRDAEES